MKSHHSSLCLAGHLARCVGRKELARPALSALLVAAIALPGPADATHRSFASQARNWTAGPFEGTRGVFFADVTGDGKADAIAVGESRVVFARSNGCMFEADEQLTSTPFFGTVATRFADVTGDGKADAIAINDDGIVVRRSEDNQRLQWSSVPFFGALGTAFADVDGDGRADAIAVTPERVIVRRSNGVNAFGPIEYWTDNPFYGSRGTYFADVDGDRRADAIVVNDWAVTVRRAYYSSILQRYVFALNENWTRDPYYGTLMNAFVDVTGDRRADAVVVNEDGIAVRDALDMSQRGFRAPDPNTHLVTEDDAPVRAWGYWTTDTFYGTRGTFFADVDGDRAADAIALNEDGVWIRRAQFAEARTACPA